MDTPRKDSPGLASGEPARLKQSSPGHPADPSDSFLERKARRRAEAKAEAEAQPSAPQRTVDYRQFFRADTSSGSFRPLNLKSGK